MGWLHRRRFLGAALAAAAMWKAVGIDAPLQPLEGRAAIAPLRVSGWVDHPGHLHPSQYLALS
jgi:hypothetical protein